MQVTKTKQNLHKIQPSANSLGHQIAGGKLNMPKDDIMTALTSLDETTLKKLTDCEAAGSNYTKPIHVLAHILVEFGAHHTDGASDRYLPEILNGLADKIGSRYRPTPELPPCEIEIKAKISGNANQRAEMFLRAFADTLADNKEMKG